MRSCPIAILLLTVLLIGCGPENVRDHPTDAEMMDRLAVKRSEFEELVRMFREDRSLGRVGVDFERTANFFEECVGGDAWSAKTIEVDKARLADYRERFASLRLKAGIEGYCKKDAVYLIASTRGLSVTGSSKGYAYLSNPPELQVDDLDSFWSSDGRSFSAYRHVDGKWYLYFDYED